MSKKCNIINIEIPGILPPILSGMPLNLPWIFRIW